MVPGGVGTDRSKELGLDHSQSTDCDRPPSEFFLPSLYSVDASYYETLIFTVWNLKTRKEWSKAETNPFIILGAKNVKHFHLQTSMEGLCTLCDVPGAEKVSVHTLSVYRHLVSFLAGSEPSFGTFRNFGFRAASVPLGQRNIAKGQRPVCLGCCGVEGQWKAKSPLWPG